MAVAVIIPAHDEEGTIAALLDALRPLAADHGAEVVVVCNGCTDATAPTARSAAPWAVVREMNEASKPAALRLGDDLATAFPRLYLDADVLLDAAGVRRLAAALGGKGVQAVAPTPRYDTEGAGAWVRSHYRVWTSLQAHRRGINGTGAMMVTASGRSRFDEWPDVIGDDYYLDGLFADDEKRRLDDVEVVVTLPRTFRACVSRRARVHQGNRQVLRAGLRRADSGGRTVLLLDLLGEQPSLIWHLPAHLAVTVSTRVVSALRRRRGRAQRFYRDATSRRVADTDATTAVEQSRIR